MGEQPDVHHAWVPITELDQADIDAKSIEVPSLLSFWEEMRGELSDRQIQDFNDRLNREWAIETGIIERLYTLDQGTTQMLIEHGIDDSLIAHTGNGKSPELIAGIVRDHQEAVEWLFDVVAQSRHLSTSFIKELHAFMTRKQKEVEGVDQFGRSTRIELDHGAYKQRPNNPTQPDGKVHQYCPPEHVDAEMERLIEFHSEHAILEVPPDVSAAWLHHRFTQIHPFQDGNGRVARALASLELIRGKWFPLVVTRNDRSDYIDALGYADGGNLQPLIHLVGAIEKQWFLRALSITKEVQRDTERLDQMLEAINDDFRNRDKTTRHDFTNAMQIVEDVLEKAKSKFKEVGDSLESDTAFGVPGRQVFTDVGLNDDLERRKWNRYQIVDAAKKLDYFANMRDYHSWVRLVLITESGRSEMLLSFHTIGPEYRGIIGASLCFYRRSQGEDGDRQITELQHISKELFQLNYKEQPAQVMRRFEPWLESALLMGLDQWRRGE